MVRRLRTLRRALWCALAGVALGMAGVIVDQAWHTSHHSGPGGGQEVLQAHWLTQSAVLVTVASMAVAVWCVTGHTRLTRTVVWTVLVATVADLVGQVWDNVMHADGRESDLAHNLSNVGGAMTLLGLLVALVLVYRRRASATALAQDPDGRERDVARPGPR